MSANLCKFVFEDGVSKQFVDDSIACVILTTEFAFGKARTRVHAAYATAENPTRCLIDISSEIGQHIAELFTDLMIKLAGESSFEVYKVDRWELKGKADGVPEKCPKDMPSN